MAKEKMPERESFSCTQEKRDVITMVGPDDDGDLVVEIDVSSDAVTWDRERVERVHAFLGRYLEKTR